MMTQLPLGIQLRDTATFENYFSGPNLQALSHLQQYAGNEGAQCVYLWGGSGTGKTHILQAACHQVSESNKATAYIPLKNIDEFSTDFLDGIDNLALVCFDDIQAIASNSEWENAIFHLYNKMRDKGAQLIIAGDASPLSIDISLPDLKSRLGWGMVYQILAMDDDEKLQAIQLRAQKRGINMPTDVARYLFRHCQRDMPAMYSLLENLDDASLAAKRRLTIPFVKEIMESP